MKEFYRINKRLYYTTMLFINLMMVLGLLINNPLMSDFGIGYILHLLLVVILIVCLLLYPWYETQTLRLIILLGVFTYFYTLFFLYPDTWSIFLFLCFIPAVSILFFDSRLFYFSLLINGISVSAIFLYVFFIDQGILFPHIYLDLVGNFLNFIGSQLIIYFIYYLSYMRLKKMQLYYEQIQQSERLKATGQLAAAVAHEVRNPLTVVKGFLQFYEKGASYSNGTKEHFKLMINELDSAEQVISQYLSIAKPSENSTLEEVNIKDVLKSITDLLQSYGLLHNNKIELFIEDNCYIEANTIELKQVFINVIKNAIEVSKVGDPVRITGGKNKNNVEIKVIDYGIGMTEAEIKSLGTPFYSLKSKGTGLGLMICYNIIGKYQGSIGFTSKKGEGTTCTVRFPIKKG
ncbi:sensor histidine kinase [Halalkalibacter okhensis]|uniref:histidine kinase n=1 Tax=Halalkalibacter okhensis TaxID=333138 RepID=A0A0B0IH93_9BACI|nr:HAMP domain-containing sensor histidine kinase [Halalkalibacter okhensis]KHF39399.1 sporulation kinase [Halalkalibacter okhensis]